MGKNQSASGLTNVIQYSNGNITFVSGSTTLMSISSSGAITTTGVISGSNALSASYAANADTLDGLDSTVFTLTSSFNAFSSSILAQTASLNSFSASILAQTASLNSFSSSVLTFTGSAATRLGALEAATASLYTATSSLNAFSASILTFTGSAATRLGALEAATSSLYSYTSSLNNKTASFATTGSNAFIGTQTITGSVLQSGSFTSTGTLTAQTLVVQTITSSVVYSSGSNIFGNTIGNTQTFTGSVLVTGSLTISTGGNASAPIIFGSTIACSPIGCFATSCATSFIGGTISGTTIYGSTAVCSPVGKFTSCIDAGSGTFSSSVTAKGTLTLGDTGVTNAIINSNDGMYFNIDADASGGSPEFMFGKGRSGAGSGGTTFLTIANTGAATFSSSVSAVAGNFSGDVTIAKTTPALILNGLGSGNSGAYVNFQGWAASNKNWQIGVANIGPAGLLFTPSTAAGGTTFSSPVFTLSDAGAATFSSTISGTTIYGSTAVCSPVGKFTSCIDAGSATFSSTITANGVANVITSVGLSGNANYLAFYESATRVGYIGKGSGGSYDFYFWNDQNANIRFGTNNTERLVIASTGAATFSSTITGTTIYGSTAVCSPVGKFSTCLDLGGALTGTTALFNLNASSTLALTSAGTNASMVKAGSGDELYIGGNDTWQMRYSGGNILMDNGGCVGIGASGPQSKLTIGEGDIRLFKTHVYQCEATWKANIFFTDEVDRKGASIVGERTAWDGAPMGLGFETGGVGTITRRMTIASTGMVVFNCDISIDNSKKLFFQGCNDANWFMGVDSTYNTIIAGAGSGARSFILRDITSGNIDRLKINWLTGISCFAGTVCAPCFATISDYRMKSNIRPIEGLSIIMNTKPYKFEYNYDCSTSFGMIAHELQDTLPEAVFGYKDGEVMQGVDYMKLLPITIKAIQEQQCTICSQASRITLLESCLGIA